MVVMKKNYFVYIVTNYTNSVLYIGVTNNLIRRIEEHKLGLVKNSFVKRYRLYKLVWYREFDNSIGAIEVEKKIKKWRREKKMKLIKQMNSGLKIYLLDCTHS